MKHFGADSNITAEQYRHIQAAVVQTAKKTLVGRQVIGMSGPPLGFGVQQFSFDVLTDMSDAELAYQLIESMDAPDLSRTNLQIPILQKDFRIEERDLLSSQRNGTPLNVTYPKSAAYKVALLEDNLILKEHANYSINGLYAGTGNTEATAADFGTAGKALVKCQLAMALLLADEIYPPYNLVLAPAQYTELLASVFTGGVSEYDRVKTLISGGFPERSQVIMSPNMTAATGMLLSADGVSRGHFEYKLALDFTTSMKRLELAEGGGIKGKVLTAGVPVIYDANAICTLTAI